MKSKQKRYKRIPLKEKLKMGKFYNSLAFCLSGLHYSFMPNLVSENYRHISLRLQRTELRVRVKGLLKDRGRVNRLGGKILKGTESQGG